ncbi:MAG: DHH family phosphoesterase [bacterium]|nr:DHH family phosphoesterase [bacterium]
MEEILNVSKAARRIKKAVKNGERIVLFSDSDMDGISSLLILQDAIEELGGKVSHVAFSNRERDGYGMALSVLKGFRAHCPALIVLTDLGIGNVKEIQEARRLGFDVIVIDHHEILGELPPANVIVNPKQPQDSYGFKTLAACGLAMKVGEKITGGKARERMAELALLGTIADRMPLEHDNMEIVRMGLGAICSSPRPGIVVLREKHDFCSSEPTAEKLDYPIAILNTRDKDADVPGGYYVLRAKTEEEAKRHILRLERKLVSKEKEVQRVAQEVRERVGNKPKALIFEEVKVSDFVLLGSIANILTREFDVPVFLCKRKVGVSVGSARSPGSFHIVEAMTRCKELLESFGGHPGAAGFRLKNMNIAKFKECLTRQHI